MVTAKKPPSGRYPAPPRREKPRVSKWEVARAPERPPAAKNSYGSQDTTCPFAHEVLKAFVAEYAIKGVPPAKVTARSPVTHKTYSLGCEIVSENTTVECSTGTATVTFPLAQAEKYKSEEEGSG